MEKITDADYPAPPSGLDVLQVRVGEMTAEVERLQSIIDEANADSAFESYLETFGGPDTNAWHDAPVDGVFKDGFNRGLLAAQQSPAVAVPDNFNGDDRKLVECATALLELDTKGALVPHGIGGHARTIIESFVSRLSVQSPRITEQDAAVTAWGEAIAKLSEGSENVHPDNIAVDRFAEAMKIKLAKCRAKGRGGWENPALCKVSDLAKMLIGHLAKGDPVDVANFAMMLFFREGGNTELSDAGSALLNKLNAKPESVGG